MIAKQNGARVVFVNKDPCALDDVADIALHGLAEEILPQLILEMHDA